MNTLKLKIKALRTFKKYIYNPIIYGKNSTLLNNSPKIFGIGKNKTGTTSLQYAMQELGFVVGNQRDAELLLYEYAKRDFKKIIEYCHNAQFFQDFPFSAPYTYIVMDNAFKESKFILTIRDNAEQWYDSLIRFNSKLFGNEGDVPDKNDLKNAKYICKGIPWEINRIYGITNEDDLFNKDIYIKNYNDYNNEVIHYFKHRPNDLLILNVAEKDSYKKLTDFLGVESLNKVFPWENKT